MTAPLRFDSLDAAVDFLYNRIDGPLHLGAPLGLGKPHRLLNAIYARAERETARPLHLYTALSLDPPGSGSGLEGRFLAPFVQRHFGADFPRLRYVEAPIFLSVSSVLTQYVWLGTVAVSAQEGFGVGNGVRSPSFLGGAIQANATFTNPQIAPSLGRNLSSGSTASVPLLEPNTLYNDRVTQLDLRFAKNFRFGQTRVKGMLDIFNATNNNTITNVNNSYGTTGASWRVPTAISLARLVKIGAQIDF